MELKTLAKLELCDLFGLNVLRHSRDPKLRRRGILMMAVWAVVLAVVCLYVGGLSYGLILLGMGPAVPAYLLTIAGMLNFFVGIFVAGGRMFSHNGYDLLFSLPVKRRDIVLSRFLRMYVEDLALTLAVLIPGTAACGWMLCPSGAFYPLMLLAALVTPLVPLAAATLLGTVITGIASRMKHKALAEAALSVLLVLAVLLGTSRMGALEGNMTPQMLTALSETVLGTLEAVYPLGVWSGLAVAEGDWAGVALCALASALAFAAVAVVVTVLFHPICRALNSHSARHDYRLGSLKQTDVLPALVRREWRRYLSSGIYVSNTIIGPVLGTVLCGALLAVGPDRIGESLGLPVDLRGMLPYAVAAVFGLVTTTCTSISMEGKHWWIAKSLPLTARQILDAKLLMNLSLLAPFYAVSEVLMILALRPVGLELVWLVLAPLELMAFACVFGITANLLLPTMDWDSEITVVKQSASVLLSMAGALPALIFAAAVTILPGPVTNAGACILTAVLTAALYRKNAAADLRRIA